VGVPLALVLFHRVDAYAFQVGFGVFLAAYAVVMMLRPCSRVPLAVTHNHEVLVGFFGGLVGGLTAMPGAVPALHCDWRGVGKEAQRATVQPFILAMQLLALTLMAIHGDISGEVAGLVTRALPALGAGVMVGLLLFGRMPDAGFRRAVLLLLLATGFALAAQPKGASFPASAATGAPPAAIEIAKKADRSLDSRY
jgi:uncharacterized protein